MLSSSFDSMEEWFEKIIEQVGDLAASHDALAVMTDTCLGCGGDEPFSFYNVERDEFNTVVLDFDDNMAEYIKPNTTNNIVVVICNTCRENMVEEEILKHSLMRLALEGTVHSFTDED